MTLPTEVWARPLAYSKVEQIELLLQRSKMHSDMENKKKQKR